MKRINLLMLMPVFIVYIVIFRFLYLENGLLTVLTVCIPIFLGLFLAVLLNPILIFIQHVIKIHNRCLAILMTYAIFFGIISLIITVVAPGIIHSIKQLLRDIPKLFSEANNLLLDFNKKYGILETETFYYVLQDYLLSYAQKITFLLTNFLNVAIVHIINAFGAIWNSILAIIISVYILMDKENFENWFYKLCFSMFEKKFAKEIVNIAYSLNKNVTNFISGKLLDSFIVGIIAYLGSKYIISSPFPIIDGLMIGITNVIPYFGAFIGGIPVTLLALLYNPYKGFLMGVFIIILQQIDSLILVPKIIGVQLSIKPIIIIISIIIGGGLFGTLGMFLATPVAALINTSIDVYMKHKLKDKNIVLPHKEY